MPSAWGLESAASVSTPGVSDQDFADFGRMRNGYGIDPDKTISPRSISFFIGGKLPIPGQNTHPHDFLSSKPRISFLSLAGSADISPTRLHITTGAVMSVS